MKYFLCPVILICLAVFTFSSCTTTSAIHADINYDYPHYGNTNITALAVKDYDPVGIIFVKSSEVIDGYGNHNGSKITYEMLMLEAQKLDAHDVINIKIDINQIEEVFIDRGYDVTRTTYNYTASALAIKYTNAIAIDNKTNNLQDISSTMIITKTEKITGSSTRGTTGTISPWSSH